MATAVDGRGRRGRNRLHIAPVRVSRGRRNRQNGRVRLGRSENRHETARFEGGTTTVRVDRLVLIRRLGLLGRRRRRVATAQLFEVELLNGLPLAWHCVDAR